VRRLPVVLGATALLLLSGGPALAEEPFRLTDQVVDEAAVVGNEAPVEDAIDELQAEDGTQLYVVFVDSFEGMGAGEWMQSTGNLSGLGGDDALLAVAKAEGWRVMRFERLARKLAIAGAAAFAAAVGGSARAMAARRRQGRQLRGMRKR